MFKLFKELAGGAIDAYKTKKEEDRIKELKEEHERLAEIADLEEQLEPNKNRVENVLAHYTKNKKEALDKFDAIAGKALDSKAEYNQLKVTFDSIKVAYDKYGVDIEKLKRDLSKSYT